MKLITDLKQNCLEPASVALGCFDGIHLGHQAVIGCAVADKPNGLTPSVFTFQENPLHLLAGYSGKSRRQRRAGDWSRFIRQPV